jgi:hypothetical protein
MRLKKADNRAKNESRTWSSDSFTKLNGNDLSYYLFVGKQTKQIKTNNASPSRTTQQQQQYAMG